MGREGPGCPRHLLQVQPAGPQHGHGSPGFADGTGSSAQASATCPVGRGRVGLQ